MNNDVPRDNAPFFFDRYPPETAHWLAGICDEANAKAGDSPYEFRKIMCELIFMYMRGGITHAFRVGEQIIVPNAPGAKHIEQQYLKYDQARSAVIETGAATTDGPASTTSTTGTQDGTPDQEAPSNDGQDGKWPSGPGCGAGTTAGTGTTVTVTGGSSGSTPQNDKDKGTGHQGTLFIVQYSDFRASVPARRKKAQTEHRRLYDVQSDAARQMRVHADELDFLDRLEAADPILEDLINTHRTESSIAGVLRAAGRTPEDLGLTQETVIWLDRQFKVV